VIARRVADASTPIGIMFHHAEMGDDDFAACEALVRTVTSHPKARVVPMRNAVAVS
jgi:hypothetical protein